MEIYFKKKSKEYGFLSNFAPYPIEIDGKTWPTVEHYFQAQKFTGLPYEEMIRSADTPAIAKKLGRDPGYPLRPDWDDIKEDIMYLALSAKFNQHPDLKRILIETGDAILIEDNRYDSYWGSGKRGTGQNRMGKLLMKLRDQLRKESDGG